MRNLSGQWYHLFRKGVDMNLSLARLFQGILGAVLGGSLALCICADFLGGINFKVIIIVSAVSFFVSFLWWEYIIKFFCMKNKNDPE